MSSQIFRGQLSRSKVVRYLILLLISVVTVSYQACGQAENQPASVTIRIPDKKTNTAQLSASSIGTSELQVLSASDINCFGIFVGGPETDLQAKNCAVESRDDIRFGIQAVGMLHGDAATLRVAAGSQRQFFFVGWNASDDQACADLKKGEVQSGKMSAPYLLAEIVQDLAPGRNSINLKGSVADAKKITSCDVFELIENSEIETFAVIDEPKLEVVNKPQVQVSGAEAGVTLQDQYGNQLTVNSGTHLWDQEFTPGESLQLTVLASPYGVNCSVGSAADPIKIGQTSTVEVQCQRVIAKGEYDLEYGASGRLVIDRGDGEYGAHLGLDSQQRPILWFEQMYMTYTCRLLASGAIDTSLEVPPQSEDVCLTYDMMGQEGGHTQGDPHGLSSGDQLTSFLDVPGESMTWLQSRYDYLTGTSSIMVSKQTYSGEPYPGFGENGVVIINTSSYDSARGLVVDALGNLVIVGSSSNNSGDGLIVRLLPDGSFDQSFGDSGILTFGDATGSDSIESVLVQSDGSLLIAGRVAVDVELTDIFVARIK